MSNEFQNTIAPAQSDENAELIVAINNSIDTEIEYRRLLRETDRAASAWVKAERELIRIKTEIKLRP